MALEKDRFFEVMEAQGLALTFDDVRIAAGRSHVPASQVDITSQFSRNVELRSPLVSAAMDTVTTSEMAIAMAKLGGIGVIHAGLGIREQRDEVRRVKLHLNGVIERPITVRPEQTLAEVLAMRETRRFEFRTFPVADTNNRLVGLITGHEFDLFRAETDRTVESTMTPLAELMSLPKGISIREAHALMQQHRKKTLPLIEEDGTIAGLYVWSDVDRLTDGDFGGYNIDQRDGRLRVAAAVPTDPEQALERLESMQGYVDVIVIDSAQGDSDFAFNTLRALKENYPDIDVVVGNISNGESARELVEAGADGIKVGQGPGSICTTRIETGIGTPQVTAVHDCEKAIRGSGVPVCADGGVRNNGDIPIAITAGAHSVMMGGMLAGTDESPGEIFQAKDGTLKKTYRGMGSPSALRDSVASRKRYGADGSGEPLSEGVETEIPYKGSVNTTAGLIIKALRRGMDYAGAPNIEHLRIMTQLIRVTNSGMAESHPHDVAVPSPR